MASDDLAMRPFSFALRYPVPLAMPIPEGYSNSNPAPASVCRGPRGRLGAYHPAVPFLLAMLPIARPRESGRADGYNLVTIRGCGDFWRGVTRGNLWWAWQDSNLRHEV